MGLAVKELRKRTSRQVLSNVTFLYPLKTSALQFVDVSSGYGNKALVTNSINVSIVQVAPPCLKLVRNILETSNLARKYTHM